MAAKDNVPETGSCCAGRWDTGTQSQAPELVVPTSYTQCHCPPGQRLFSELWLQSVSQFPSAPPAAPSTTRNQHYLAHNMWLNKRSLRATYALGLMHLTFRLSIRSCPHSRYSIKSDLKLLNIDVLWLSYVWKKGGIFLRKLVSNCGHQLLKNSVSQTSFNVKQQNFANAIPDVRNHICL